MTSIHEARAEPGPHDITRLLVAWRQGQTQAEGELIPLIYDRLCEIARGYLCKERQDHTLDTSGLVHEAYLKLIDQTQVDWKDRAHFFAVASSVMRRILVDNARERKAQKRGGGVETVVLEDPDLLPSPGAPDLLALDEALEALAANDSDGAKLVEMRYFGGLTKEELAEVMGVSTATISRRWRLVRAWLRSYLLKGEHLEL